MYELAKFGFYTQTLWKQVIFRATTFPTRSSADADKPARRV